MKRFSDLTYKKQKNIVTVLFLFIPLLLIVIFGYLPVINMLGYSFTKWDGLGAKEWIGLKNYIDVFTKTENYRVFGVSLYYFGGAIIQLCIALVFATFLSFKMKGQNFFKGVLFFPNLINGVAIGFIFLYFFRLEGTLNSFLKILGIKSDVLWLTNPKIINYSLAFTSIWRYMGFNLIMFIGAIQAIPNDIFEAAALDGVSPIQKFRFIILPQIAPIVQLNLILAVKGAVSVFEIPYIISGGGNGSSTFVIRTIDTAFKFNKIGLASAMAIVLTIIVLLVTALQQAFFKEKN